ncbi:2-keto-4-pentenoate hydratase [Nocardioides jensenii]|uniref:2-keto-4-pentenoate hydratase n=1 Tax=Nocardioides jensenii TaxID=1843 RepID=UPI000831E452|nr:fumarylacetoacetate hydrolase family protein [Nocardioides jensenii]
MTTTPAVDRAVDQAAQRLLEAARTQTPCPPVRDLIGAADVALAYAVQERLTAARMADGAVVVGHKIGLTSPAVQQQLGVDRPDFGVLFDDMGYADSAVVPIERLLQPKVEAEIAFVLAEDLVEGDLDVRQVREAVDYAVAAIEIVDSRVAGWDIKFGDTVADNASSGLYTLGTRQVPLSDFEPVEAEMTMSIDGEVVSTGNGAACLGDPLAALSWLARTAREVGTPLRAGHIVLSGALGPMAPVVAGSTVTAEISGLGSVTANFSGSHSGSVNEGLKA